MKDGVRMQPADDFLRVAFRLKNRESVTRKLHVFSSGSDNLVPQLLRIDFMLSLTGKKILFYEDK